MTSKRKLKVLEDAVKELLEALKEQDIGTPGNMLLGRVERILTIQPKDQ